MPEFIFQSKKLSPANDHGGFTDGNDAGELSDISPAIPTVIPHTRFSKQYRKQV
jgi:hypothetical protein